MVFQTQEKHKIQVIRGTTKALRVTIRDANGNPYTLREGDIVRFGVKLSTHSTRYLIEQETAEVTDGAALFRLSPEDTAELDVGKYKYDVGLQSGPDYLNVIPYSTFEVCPNVTGKKPTDAAGGIEDVVELEGTIEAVPASVGGNGEDGGYYIPEVTQVDDDTVKFTYTPSGKDMPPVPEQVIELPRADSSQNANGLTAEASALLITILRNGVYSTDQSANITALETALGSSGDSGGDSGGWYGCS